MCTRLPYQTFNCTHHWGLRHHPHTHNTTPYKPLYSHGNTTSHIHLILTHLINNICKLEITKPMSLLHLDTINLLAYNSHGQHTPLTPTKIPWCPWYPCIIKTIVLHTIHKSKPMVRDQEFLSQGEIYPHTSYPCTKSTHSYPMLSTTLELGVMNATNCYVNITTTCGLSSSNRGNTSPLKH